MTGGFAIHDVALFDGQHQHDRTTVVVNDDTIVAVERDPHIPTEWHRIAGHDKTLLPGLIDSHVHLGLHHQLAQALSFGVTTLLDMYNDPRRVAEWKQLAARDNGVADIRSAGWGATCPGGHPTQMGGNGPTLQHADEAEAFVQARVAEGSDWIKIISDDLRALGGAPTLDAATITALVHVAHRHKKLAAIHVGYLEGAHIALDAGADILAHAWADQPPDTTFLNRARQQGLAVIPTLTVLGGASHQLPNDPRLRPYLDNDDVTHLTTTSGFGKQTYDLARNIVARLHDAGLQILAGTDAATPGTMYGISVHEELKLLVDAGLTPSQALTSATATPAAVFGLTDRGHIAPGLQADLLLIHGNPTRDIAATRHIHTIWRRGVQVDRRDTARRKAQALSEWKQTIPAPDVGDGSLVHITDGQIRSPFGSGWQPWTDAGIGGSSTAQLRHIDNTNGTQLQISGTVVPGQGPRWAGIIFMPGQTPLQPTNLATAKGVTFEAAGDGQTYAIGIYTASSGYIPSMQMFTSTREWQTHTYSWDTFPVDPTETCGIMFSAGEPGEFQFKLRNPRLVT